MQSFKKSQINVKSYKSDYIPNLFLSLKKENLAAIFLFTVSANSKSQNKNLLRWLICLTSDTSHSIIKLLMHIWYCWSADLRISYRYIHNLDYILKTISSSHSVPHRSTLVLSRISQQKLILTIVIPQHTIVYEIQVFSHYTMIST